MVVELVRVDEQSAGIVAVPDGAGALEPQARGSTVAVIGRAWVEEVPGVEPSRDTGDCRRSEQYASETDPGREVLRYDAAIRAAASELGRALARRVLGLPEPALDT
jgi:hypothetical protein